MYTCCCIGFRCYYRFAPCWRIQTRMTHWCRRLLTHTSMTKPSTNLLLDHGHRNMRWVKMEGYRSLSLLAEHGDGICYVNHAAWCYGNGLSLDLSSSNVWDESVERLVPSFANLIYVLNVFGNWWCLQSVDTLAASSVNRWQWMSVELRRERVNG